MKPVIILVLLIVAVIMIYYFYKGKSISKNEGLIDSQTELVFDNQPDLPVGFGYKSQWFVIKTENTAEVANALNLTNLQAANWSTGIDGAYDGYYFVTPSVNGWTVVINSFMPDLTESTNESPLKVIEKFSRKYGEAYYFGTHRIVDYHAWAKAVNGEIVRAYGYLGESGETLINKGETTPEELKHHFVYTGVEVDEPVLPNEEDVLLLSKEWAIDPLMNYDDLRIGVGLVGK